MDNRERIFFEKLSAKRNKDSIVFLDPEYYGVFRPIVDKYPDSAHFIYELLQNADDAEATSIHIRLLKKGLLFKHNGKTRFHVSNPETVVDDKKNGKLGGVNSITSIGFSTKNDNSSENKIGKFGIGFKSVFQYTKTPHIYDGNICFKITDYIVPTLLDEEPPIKVNENETLFYLPFINSDEAYNVIEKKLNSLDNPILFLHNIKKIEWDAEINCERKIYTKKIKEKRILKSICCELLNINNNGNKTKIWMFSRDVDLPEGKFPISVGFLLKKDGKSIDTSWKPNIFCFFSTSENTGLCMILHAPFELVDNRQQIKQDNKVNKKLFDELATLAADSLLCLRDIGIDDRDYYINNSILDIVPLEDPDCDSWTIIGAFYDAFVNILKKEELLITSMEKYISCKNAIWSKKKFSDLLNTSQLNILLKSKNYDFVFIDVGMSREGVYEYIKDTLKIKTFEESDFVNGFTKSFMKNQTNDWLISFYEFLCRTPDILSKRYHIYNNFSFYNSSYNDNPLCTKPIVKIESGDFAEPFIYEKGALRPNVYLPSEGFEFDYNIVNKKFLKNEYFKKVIHLLEIKTPDKEDFIKNVVLPKYREGELSVEDAILLRDFEAIYLYYSECKQNEIDDFMSLINKTLFLRAYEGQKKSLYRISNLYADTEELHKYFNFCKVQFFDKKFYNSLLRKYESGIENFLKKLNFKYSPEIKLQSYYFYNFPQISLIKTDHRYGYVHDYNMEGLDAFLKSDISKEKSIALWNFLIKIDITYYKTRHSYQPGNDGRRNFVSENNCCDSDFIIKLKSAHWIYTKKNVLKKTNKIYLEELNEDYERNEELERCLNIISSPAQKEQELIKTLSKETQTIFGLGNEAREFFGSRENMREAKALFDRNRRMKNDFEDTEVDNDDLIMQPSKRSNDDNTDNPESLKDIFGGRKIKDERSIFSNSKSNVDQREKHLAKLEEKKRKEIEREEQIFELEDSVDNVDKYTFKWFKGLLELEYLNSGEESFTKKALHIVFGNVSYESNRIIVLSSPSRYIPMFLEENGNIEVTLYFKDQTDQKLNFEVANVKDFVLRLKCNKEDINLIEEAKKKTLTRAELKAEKPIKLVERLNSAFCNLDIEDEYSLKENITRKIKFIFGPPGTGKTTRLSKLITDLINGQSTCKVLVLAPTNKACDVLTCKLLDENKERDVSWIWRFVASGEPRIENEGVIRLRESHFTRMNKVCVISTIARFPYDGFEEISLREISWDYIVFDEASMISLAQIIYPLYKCMDTSFIIAGDPFQIEPIVHEERWSGENIYTMVNLLDFINPHTEPIPFEIENLKKQYRAIPTIGDIFSKYAYGGALKHIRKTESRRVLNLDGLNINTINYITFPVFKESIFSAKKLVSSNIHIYSALLVYEFMLYISRQIDKNHTNEIFRIGVICPYKAEAEVISKLWEQRTEQFNNVEVSIGTIHSFQGDECDIILSVFNPPASGLKRNPEKVFVNNKNIMNVAVSRARDYLFMFIPEKEYELFDNLTEIRRVGRITIEEKTSVSQFKATQIENVLFGDRFYLEGKTFVTTHQLANVYTEPTQKYEVRIDDNSIDIQMK